MKNKNYFKRLFTQTRAWAFIFNLLACGMMSANLNAQNVNVNPGGGTYPTMKAAFNAINAGTHTGAVTIDIVANTAEPSMAILNASGVGSSSYTSVTITTSVGGVTVAGSDTATIKLAGADNVTIDGRIAGTGRNITVSNSRTLTNSSAIWLAHGGYAANDSAGAQNNIIRNLEIACGVAQNTATTVTFGINSGGTAIGSVSGRNNDNNQYLENRIIKCRIAINLNGGTAVNLNDNNIISGNIVGPTSFGADEIGGTGIFVQFQNLCSITNNLVQFVGGDFANTTAGADRVGIGLGQNAWTSTSTTTTTGSNCTVAGNIIHDIIEERTFSAAGIVAGTTLSGPKTNNLIANNVIYNVRANSTPGDQCVGIGHTGGPGDKIVFNSISMTGDLDPPAAGTASTNPIAAGIAKHLAAAADTAVFIKNNSILLDVNTNTTTLLKAAIIAPAAGYAYGSGGLNNNDYFIPTPGTNGNVTGVAGTGTTSYATLALWQAVYTPAQDASSIQANPIYNSGSFLKPVTGSPLVGAGTPVATVPLDIEGTTRSGSTPTIGAYETATPPPPPDAGVSAALVGTTGQILGAGSTYNITATAKNFGSSSFSVCPVYYRVNGGSAVGPVNTVGPIAPNGTENVTFSGGNAFTPATAGSYTIKSWTELPTDVIATNDTFTVVVTVIDPITSYPYVERFTTPTNWTILFENTVGTTALWGLGICKNAFGKPADTAATSNCFNGSSGRVEVLRSPILNLTSMVNPVVHFYSSYRTFTGTECDTLDVLVSTNGGVTFFPATTIYKKHRNSAPSLSTRPGSGSAFFPDSAVQWRYETVSLANVSGMNNVVIGFRSHSNFGNRMWVDDVVVTDANNTCTNTFSAPGTYSCDAPLSIQMVTANPASSEMRTTRHDAQDPPFTTASPSVATNATATSNNGAIYTPTYLGKIKWWSVSYTGNDQTNGNAAGFTTFNISIDVTTLEAINDLDSVYIVRRADALDAWSALTTTRSGNILTASSRTLFGDFDIATTVSNATACTPLTPTITGSTSFCTGGSTTLDAGSGYSLYNWSTGATTQTINVNTANTFTVTVTDGNGCTGSDSETTTVNVNPTPAITGSTSFCTGGSTTLDAGSGYSLYNWSTGATTQTINVNTATTVTVTVTDGNGCTGSDSETTTVNANPTPAITGSTSFCTGGSTTLDAGSGYSLYNWSTGATTQTINVNTATTVTVTVTDGNGCTGSDSETTTINAGLTPTITGSTSFCTGGSTTLDAGSGYSLYNWSTGATTQTINVNTANTFTVTVTDGNGCTGSDNETTTITTAPTATISGNNSICLAQSSQVQLTFTGTGPWSGTVSDGSNTVPFGPVGTTSTNVTVTPGSAGTHNYTVTALSDANCGTGSGSGTAVILVSTAPPTNNAGPVTPSSPEACSGTVLLINTTTITGQNVRYSWNTGSNSGTVLYSTNIGGPFSPGPFQTTSPTVYAQFGTLAGSSGYSVCVQGVNGCGSTNNKCTWVRGVVSVPGTISPANPVACPNDVNPYSCGASAGATVYNWTLGGSATPITSGQGTTNVTVTFPPAFTSGQLCVTAALACGGSSTSAPRCMTISNTPAVPGTITGPAKVCPGATGVVFSVAAVTGATGYSWTVPAGCTITSGTNTTSITVNFPTPYTGAPPVCVSATSSCASSATRCKTVGTNLPGQPGSMTGPTSNICNSTVQYSIPNVANATSYNWTNPLGTTISSGQGTTTILLQVGPAFTSGQLTVVASTLACTPGNSPPRTITIAGKPNQPGSITANPVVWCTGGFVNFSVSPVSPLPVYNWTTTNGTITAGQGTDNIDVTWGATAAGTVNVTAGNGCGTSTVRSLPFSSGCREEGTELNDQSSILNVYPNPAHDKVTVSIDVKESSDFTLQLMDVSGRVVLSETLAGTAGVNTYELNVTNLSKGVYMLEVKSAQDNWKTKVAVE